MAVDLGIKRTGLALCDKDEMLAYPYKLLCESDEIRCLKKVFHEYTITDAEKIVVGLPRNMDGTFGISAQRAIDFGETLQKKYNVKVDFYDERQTTVLALNFLNEIHLNKKKRKKTVDMLSATIILQNYLDFIKNRCKLD